MPRCKVSRIGTLDAFLRNARLRDTAFFYRAMHPYGMLRACRREPMSFTLAHGFTLSSQLHNYTYRRVWRILRRGGELGGFETRPYGTVDTVFLGSRAAPHGFAISSV